MTIDTTLVQNKLIEVLQTIQTASGLECPPIDGKTKPLEALPNFDSKIWPTAIGMLAAGLGITIPNDVNIFAREKTCIALNINEIVALVVELEKANAATKIEMVNTK
jgi:hypothetical protein